jgi:hypothetical protein
MVKLKIRESWQAGLGIKGNLISKIIRAKRAGSMVQDAA